jgi:hypothetical protein
MTKLTDKLRFAVCSGTGRLLNPDGPEAADRIEALEAVVAAARKMPRATPAAGGCSTVHPFAIEAFAVWDLDRALTALDKLEPSQ